MNARTLLLGMVVMALLAALPAIGQDSVEFTGKWFSSFGGNVLSAQIEGDDPFPEFPVIFKGTTLWGNTLSAGFVFNDPVGTAVALGTWPPAVYRTFAIVYGASTVKSVENAVTIYSPRLRGLACGGVVDIGTINEPQRATVGFVYQNMAKVTIPLMGSGTKPATCATIRSFLFDIDSDSGSSVPAASIWSVDFKKVNINYSGGVVTSIDLEGKVLTQLGLSPKKYMNMIARFDFVSDPEKPLLSLYVYAQTIFGFQELVSVVDVPIEDGGFFVKTI